MVGVVFIPDPWNDINPLSLFVIDSAMVVAWSIHAFPRSDKTRIRTIDVLKVPINYFLSFSILFGDSTYYKSAWLSIFRSLDYYCLIALWGCEIKLEVKLSIFIPHKIVLDQRIRVLYEMLNIPCFRLVGFIIIVTTGQLVITA